MKTVKVSNSFKTGQKSILASMLFVAFSLFLSVQTAQAKKIDFSSIIQDNEMAQQQMHGKLKSALNEKNLIVNQAKDQNAILDTAIAVESESINSPTDAEFLTFSKEKNRFKPSKSQTDKRLAQEIEDLQ